MAALVLSTVGNAAGTSLFGPTGAIVGRLVGALAGNAIDRVLFAPHSERRSTARGSPISPSWPRPPARRSRASTAARGSSGQVIWATNLDEVVNTSSDTTRSGGKGMGGGASVTTTTTTTYSYFANIAVGLCEGPIGAVLRVWADGKPLDLSGLTMRTYIGDEAQTPDPLIVAKDGDVPAYRGLAYVVFERLPLENFGNRIPQLSFEVLRPVGRLEEMMKAVTLIPGATEFGYEPGTVVRTLGPGQSAPENRHVTIAASDVIASLDELQAVAPNLERVAIVVAWFGSDLRAGECRVVPKVDNAIKETFGATWSVAGACARGRAGGVERRRPSRLRRHAVGSERARSHRRVESARPQGDALSVPDDGHRRRTTRSPDPWTGAARSRPIRGAAASPAIRRRGRRARPTAPARRPIRSMPSSAAAPTRGTTAT